MRSRHRERGVRQRRAPQTPVGPTERAVRKAVRDAYLPRLYSVWTYDEVVLRATQGDKRLQRHAAVLQDRGREMIRKERRGLFDMRRRSGAVGPCGPPPRLLGLPAPMPSQRPPLPHQTAL